MLRRPRGRRRRGRVRSSDGWPDWASPWRRSLLTDYPYVSLVRADGTDGTVTVDDLDQTMGGAALVLGLEDLLASGTGGAYGVKDGAEPLRRREREAAGQDRTRERSTPVSEGPRARRGARRGRADRSVRLRAPKLADEVVVVDDGSTDRTASEASSAARLAVAPRRKGGRALEGACAGSDRRTCGCWRTATSAPRASNLAPLLEVVTSGQADLAIAVLPPARAGGFGSRERVAAHLIRGRPGSCVRAAVRSTRAHGTRCKAFGRSRAGSGSRPR